LFRVLYNLYFKYTLPLIGRLVSRDPSAYRYLYESVMHFPEGEAFQRHLMAAGFSEVADVRLSFGIATIYLATKG